ncbi:MAG: lipopolysaccharide transport periplasmic protein LptA [Deltaproteobacteria bacterium]|nr:lipopolysaccharide transport periplasmic protein LptA [Deltaproteobacteria bacterium]
MFAIIYSAGVAAGQTDAPAPMPGAPVTITSDRVEADKVSGVVVFKGNVAAVEDFTLCSDELTITYGAGNEVSEMRADGNVRIFQDGKTARSDSAVYKRQERTVVLSGHSQVEQCVDTVKGERITMRLDDNTASVEGAGAQRVKAVITPGKNCGKSSNGGTPPPAADARAGAKFSSKLDVKTPPKVAGDEALCKGPR